MNANSYYRDHRRNEKLENEEVDQRASTTAPEIERLLGESRLGIKDDLRKCRLKGRAQRITENGETLRYIELVLRQLRRASRDHRQLVEERHRINAAQPLCKSSTTRAYHSSEAWISGRRTVRDHDRIPWDRSPASRCKRQESFELTEFAGFDIATKLLTKRKSYGTGFNIAETTPRRIHERPSNDRIGFRHVPGYAGIDTAIIQ